MSVVQILYQFFIYGVPLAVAGALFGLRWKEGLWGNILGVFAMLFSMLVAIGWWESFAALISENANSMLYLSDYIAIWVLFLFSLAVISEMTRALSRVKVKFADLVEKGGNTVALGLMTAMLLGFFSFTMELSPIGENKDATPPAGDSILTQAFRQLTAGNLSSFVAPKAFDEHGEIRNDHFLRRQKLMEQAVDKNTLLYEGSIPPRKN